MVNMQTDKAVVFEKVGQPLSRLSRSSHD